MRIKYIYLSKIETLELDICKTKWTTVETIQKATVDLFRAIAQKM